MTPEQKKFWNILKQPYNKCCSNCLYNNITLDPIWKNCGPCKLLGFERPKCIQHKIHRINGKSRWKWDKVTYE